MLRSIKNYIFKNILIMISYKVEACQIRKRQTNRSFSAFSQLLLAFVLDKLLEKMHISADNHVNLKSRKSPFFENCDCILVKL